MLNNGEKTDYAFGLHVGEYKGLKTIRHGGDGIGFEHEMIRFPDQRFSVIRLCNAANIPWGQSEQVADIFLADQFKKSAGSVDTTVPAISIPEKELASLAGTYFDPLTSSSHSYYMKDGKLMIFNSVLSPIGQNRFKVIGGGPPGLEIVFVRPVAGGPMQVKHVIGVRTTTYYAVQNMTPIPTSAQLAEFTGKYHSDELEGPGATYTLSIKDGKLVLAAMGRKDILLTRAFGDTFLIFGLIQWYPGEPNRPSNPCAHWMSGPEQGTKPMMAS